MNGKTCIAPAPIIADLTGSCHKFPYRTHSTFRLFECLSTFRQKRGSRELDRDGKKASDHNERDDRLFFQDVLSLVGCFFAVWQRVESRMHLLERLTFSTFCDLSPRWHKNTGRVTALYLNTTSQMESKTSFLSINRHSGLLRSTPITKTERPDPEKKIQSTGWETDKTQTDKESILLSLPG